MTMEDKMIPQHLHKTTEWYTPPYYVHLVERVFGGRIDLDPASCAAANKHVNARKFFTREQNGLRQSWCGKVFLNPPYGRGIDKWLIKLTDHYDKGDVSEAIVLVNATPASGWWVRLGDFPVCFTNHRIKFWSNVDQPKNPTHGNAFVYLGPNSKNLLFYGMFRLDGWVYMPMGG